VPFGAIYVLCTFVDLDYKSLDHNSVKGKGISVAPPPRALGARPLRARRCRWVRSAGGSYRMYGRCVFANCSHAASLASCLHKYDDANARALGRVTTGTVDLPALRWCYEHLASRSRHARCPHCKSSFHPLASGVPAICVIRLRSGLHDHIHILCVAGLSTWHMCCTSLECASNF
jgi:hypothetical protein